MARELLCGVCGRRFAPWWKACVVCDEHYCQGCYMTSYATQDPAARGHDSWDVCGRERCTLAEAAVKELQRD